MCWPTSPRPARCRGRPRRPTCASCTTRCAAGDVLRLVRLAEGRGPARPGGAQELVADAFERRFVDPTVMGFEHFLEDLRPAQASPDPYFLLHGSCASARSRTRRLNCRAGTPSRRRAGASRAALAVDGAFAEGWDGPQPVVNPLRVGRAQRPLPLRERQEVQEVPPARTDGRQRQAAAPAVRALSRPGPAHPPRAKTPERRRAKSCPVTSPAMAPAILAPPRTEGSIGLA